MHCDCRNKSFGDAGSVSGTQTILILSEGFSHDCGLVPESPRRATFSSPIQAGEACPSLSADQVSVSHSGSHSKGSEPGSRPTSEAGLGTRSGVEAAPQVVSLLWQRLG